MKTYNTSDLIMWDFTIASQGYVSRYGRLGGVYLKQFLPGGIEFKERHPPRSVDKRTYDLAKKVAGRQKG